MREQRVRGGVDIHAYAVHAVLHHAVKRLFKARFLHIVLILTDADCLGIDLDQLGKRILQTSGNRDGTALGHVEVGELLLRQLGGGIDARAGFADDGVGNAS